MWEKYRAEKKYAPTKVQMSILVGLRDKFTVVYREKRGYRAGQRTCWFSFRYYPCTKARTMNTLEREGLVTRVVDRDELPSPIEGHYEITEKGVRATKEYMGWYR